MGRRRFGIAALGLMAALSFAISGRSAEACSCLEYHATAVWPADGTTDVPVDTTLVIAASRGDVVAQALTDPEGNTIPLRHIRTLDAGSDCAFQDYVFVRPVAPLAPNTRYAITPSFPSVDVTSGTRATSFTTGARHAVTPTMSAKLWLFADETDEGKLMQVFASVASDHPAFILAAGERLAVSRQVEAGFSGEPIVVPLGIVPCARVEVVDVTGTTRHSTNRCQPQKCARPVNISISSCGDHPVGRSWADWQTVSNGCMGVSEGDRSSPGGCSVGRSPSGSSASLFVLLVLVGLGLRRKEGLR